MALITHFNGREARGVCSVLARVTRQHRFIAAVTMSLAAGTEGYLSHGPTFGFVCVVVGLTITLAIFDAFDAE
jgi:hypothetical protein